MLTEIYCDQFHKKKVTFNDGLNVILGTNTGNNSIGKSTFLLIVDFVFGGTTYSKSQDILSNVGDHLICWAFEFENEKYYFSRSMSNSNYVNKCNSDYTITDSSIVLSEYNKWLMSKYKIDLPDLSFRDIVSLYTRVYGKENCSEKEPLHTHSKEKEIVAIYNLLKLFDLYSPISILSDNAKKANDDYQLFTKAQKAQFIAKINKTIYQKNIKRLEELRNLMSNLSEGLEKNLLDADSQTSEEAARIKKLLSQANRRLGQIKFQLSQIDDNLEYAFSKASHTFEELKTYFPTLQTQSLEEVEEFHKKISTIFIKENKDKKRELLREKEGYIKIVSDLKSQLTELVGNPNLSSVVLRQHATYLTEKEQIKLQNESYIKSVELKRNKDETQNNLEQVQNEQLGTLENKINYEMNCINDIIYNGKFNAPTLHFNKKTYTFFTPNDTGTGIAYKGLIVFDLSVLQLTPLPILVHDSLLFKNISDEAIEKIIELYSQSSKQVIIALDKEDSYSTETQNMLMEKAVLRLANNGEELFGRSWAKK